MSSGFKAIFYKVKSEFGHVEISFPIISYMRKQGKGPNTKYLNIQVLYLFKDSTALTVSKSYAISRKLIWLFVIFHLLPMR